MSCVRCQVSGVKCHVSGVKCHFFFLFSSDKVLELVGGGSVINGAYPVSLCHHTRLTWDEVWEALHVTSV